MCGAALLPMSAQEYLAERDSAAFRSLLAEVGPHAIPTVKQGRPEHLHGAGIAGWRELSGCSAHPPCKFSCCSLVSRTQGKVC